MTREEIKNEIVWRYKFIYENIFYIMEPFMSNNRTLESKEFSINKRIPYELLNLVQKFLLEDGISQYSEFVKYVERRKLDKNYGMLINKKQDSIYDKEKIVWELLNSVCYLIMNQERNSKIKVSKLRVMDEYYKILNYENNEIIKKYGSSLIANYLKNERANGKYIFNRNIYGLLNNSMFIKYVSDKKNYNTENLSILTEKEKQEIYLMFHEEIAWDMKVKCEIDKHSLDNPRRKHLLRQDINPPCGEEFYVVESRMFINPKETCYEYYQSCPKCGYVVNIPQEIIPEGVKTRIKERGLKYKYEFPTMLLSAELRSMDYRDDVLVKRRIK